jgi:8-oxo-dGTP diphosphatase
MDTKDCQFDIPELLSDFSAKLPHFPDDRIDYTVSDIALVLTCFVALDGKILILKRSDKVGTYRGMWNSVAGYIDEAVPLEEKIYEELREELGITAESVSGIVIGRTYEFHDEDLSKTWIIVPCLATLKTEPRIVLDWEHTDYRWIEPSSLKEYEIVPNLDISYAHIKK